MSVACPCRSGTGYWLESTCRPLGPAEMAAVNRAAIAQYEASRSFRDSVGEKDRAAGIDYHVIGLGAELAWCILEGIPWLGYDLDAYLGRFKGTPDILPDIDIRCTSNPAYRSVILRRKDNLEDPAMHGRRIVAAFWNGQVFSFRGWLWGREALAWPLVNFRAGPPARIPEWSGMHRLPFYRDRRRHSTPE